MKLHSGLQLAAIFPILLAIVIALEFWFWRGTTHRFLAEQRFVEAVVIGLSDLGQATDDYLIHRNDAARDNWKTSYDALESTLGTAMPRSEEERDSIQQLRDDHVKLDSLFTALEGALTQRRTEEGARLTQELSQTSVAMLKCITQIARNNQMQMIASQEDGQMLIVMLTAVLALIMCSGALLLSRGIVNRVEALHSGVKAVGAGNLAHTVKVTGHDELSQLAQTFNAMTRELQKSYAALDAEVQNHKKTADVLQRSNMQLSDSFIKLKRAQRQVVDQERLQALKQMASGLTHDFNNALMPILGTSEYLLQKNNLTLTPEETRDCLQTIRDAAQRAGNVVKQLVEFFQPVTVMATQQVNLNTVVQEVIAHSEAYWKVQAEARGTRIQIATQLLETPIIDIDVMELREALTQIVFNAADAITGNGRITFTTRAEDQFVVLEIADTGTGMTEEVRRRCLEPFFSTKGPEATGMGLTLASTTIRRHNGTIEVESLDGHGTKVLIRLPTAKLKLWTDQTPEVVPPLTRKLRILAVDDQRWSRDLLVRLLGMDGHTVEAVAKGSEALEILPRSAWDLVITDMAMPEMNGNELAKTIHKTHPRLPIILLTGFGDIMDTEATKPRDIDAILCKPISYDDILQTIARVINRSATSPGVPPA